MTKGIPIYSIDRFRKNNTRNEFQIEVFTKNRNFNVAYPHRHDFFEILYITEGHGTHIIDFIEYEIKPNSIFFLSPGQIHTLDLSDNINGFIFLFTSEFYLLNKQDNNKLLELPFFYPISNEAPPLFLSDENDIDFLNYLFKQACNENMHLAKDTDEMCRSMLDIILILCKRLYPINASMEKMSKGKLLVKKFKQIVEEKYLEYKSLKEYSDYLGVTANHLSESVKQFTGRNATDIIRDKIILETKRLLIHSDLSISEIAFQLNFTDQSYFSKYFKNSTGLSPGDFRKSVKIT